MQQLKKCETVSLAEKDLEGEGDSNLAIPWDSRSCSPNKELFPISACEQTFMQKHGMLFSYLKRKIPFEVQIHEAVL